MPVRPYCANSWRRRYRFAQESLSDNNSSRDDIWSADGHPKCFIPSPASLWLSDISPANAEICHIRSWRLHGVASKLPLLKNVWNCRLEFRLQAVVCFQAEMLDDQDQPPKGG